MHNLPVEVAFLAHGEEISERTLGHLLHSSFSSVELSLHEFIIFVCFVEYSKNFQSIFITALEDEPTW